MKCDSAARATLLVVILLHPVLLRAQEPDTLAAGRDTLALPDSLAQAPDSLPTDTIVPAFPLFPEPAGSGPGLMQLWEMGDLLGTGAMTLGDLVEFTPWLEPVRGGFLEGPQAGVYAGRGAASVRFNEDGYELVPLLGGALDLRLEPLVQLERLQLVYEPGGVRFYGHSYRNPRREPYSRIEAGTGDRRANLLRGFLSSRIGRGLAGFGFDRIDTAGRPDLGSSSRNVVWLSLSHALPFDVWGQIEYRNATADRESFESPKRSDWILRLRRALGKGWQSDLVAGTGRLKLEPRPGEDVEAVDESAQQVGFRAARAAENWRTYVALRYWQGENVPPFESEGTFEWSPGPLSLYTAARFAHWEDFNSAALLAALRLDLLWGFGVLAEAEEGDRGIFGRVPRRRLGFTRWSVGAEQRLWGWRIGARGGRYRADPSVALGPPLDSLVALPGGTVNVVEAWAAGPLFRIFGGRIEGAGRYTARDEGQFLYWPKDGWRLEGLYRLTALNGQLDFKLTGMIGRRGPMWVGGSGGVEGAVLTGELVWWRTEAVVRIKDVYIYYNYEFFDSPGAIGDLPQYEFPRTRYHFGVKWEFWN